MMKIIYGSFFMAAIVLTSCKQDEPKVVFAETSHLQIGGILGQGLDSSQNGRLKWFIQDQNSEAIRIFHNDSARKSPSRGWKGECAGKWLYAASRCAIRTHDTIIRNHIKDVAGFLISQQGPDGYIGTFNDSARFTGNPVKPNQTYDLWMCGYIMQGLMEAYKLLHDTACLSATKKLGDLCIATYQKGNKKIVNAGPFGGTASACILEHFADLYDLTHEKRYLDFAEFCLQELEARPGTELISRTLLNYDVSQINEGKMYEILHCYVGVAKLAHITGNETYLKMVQNAWNEVYTYHQNAAGAPCGGMGHHLECYNVRYMFSPYFHSETCAMMDWLRLNIELFGISGEAKYAEQIEKIAYNALLGAQFSDGYGWIYHSVMNGRRIRTDQFACCSSSGTVALEEIPPVIYTLNEDGVSVNIYTPSAISVNIKNTTIQFEQVTDYPFEGKISIKVEPEKETSFPLSLRIPYWTDSSEISINGKKMIAKGNTFYTISKSWKKGDVIEVEFPMNLRTVEKVYEYNQKGEYVDGSTWYTSVYRGPLLYATEWKDALRNPNTINVQKGFSASQMTLTATPEGYKGNAYELKLPDTSLVFVPYYQAAHRVDTSYHACWMKMKK